MFTYLPMGRELVISAHFLQVLWTGGVDHDVAVKTRDAGGVWKVGSTSPVTLEIDKQIIELALLISKF